MRQGQVITGKLGKRILVVFSAGCGENGAGGGCGAGAARQQGGGAAERWILSRESVSARIPDHAAGPFQAQM